VLSPGPVTTALISQSPRLGWITGPLVSIGMP
jgi:threonine/homoserine/homoserine lactone efflux protein